MTIEIVDWPMDSMVIFHRYVNVYQRVKQSWASHMLVVYEPIYGDFGDGLLLVYPH